MSKEKLADSVLEHLGMEIARGTFPVGAALPTEPELMEALGVGRSSVREAVRALSSRGMVDTAPRRGTVVAPREHWNTLNREVMRWMMSSPEGAPELLKAIDEARRIFEPASAALVAQKADRLQVIAIETAFALMEDAAARGDTEAAIQADRQFHLQILRATNNPILEAFDSALDAVLGILFGVTANHMENFRANLANHLAVLEAIRRKDPQGAERAMLDTIEFTTRKMQETRLIT